MAQDTAMSMNLSALLTQMDTPAQAHQMFRQPGAHLRPVSRGCASRLRPFLLISFSSLVAVCRRSEIDGRQHRQAGAVAVAGSAARLVLITTAAVPSTHLRRGGAQSVDLWLAGSEAGV